ncbi:hypothetical protein QZH41_020055 [Actinostola sp. cb2023]|nr:hypothetical protein QZH41_020055 [Actinostola sp. cb2023]
MEEVIVTAHPLYGYQFDIQQRTELVQTIPNLAIGRTSVFDEVRTPAYKKQHNIFQDYTIGRSSPIWLVKKGTMTPNNRLTALSQPKRLHPKYLPCKSIMTEISSAAKVAACSNRIEILSEPKKRIELPQREWQIKKASLRATASVRTEELSHPRGHPMGFVPDKFESWRVSKAAVGARPSSRIEELSKPMTREKSSNLPKEDAFIVSPAARNAQCSDRVYELAQPLKREA